MILRRRTALALPALLAGCAAPLPPATPPTPLPDEGGIGGTGVFGVVTRLGSLVVNGLTIDLDAATRVETLAGLGLPQPGDAVALHALGAPRALRATRVTLFLPVIGPFERRPDGRPAVLGTPLDLAPDVPIRGPGDARLAREALRPGMRVAVSGLWRDEAIVATSLTLLPQGDAAEIRGVLRRDGLGVRIGATRLTGGDPALPAEHYAVAIGRATPGGLEVSALRAEPPPLLAPQARGLAVEGYLAPNRDSPGFHLAGFGLPLAGGPPPAAFGRRALLLGRFEGGFAIGQSLPLPEAATERARVLEDAPAEAARAAWLAGLAR